MTKINIRFAAAVSLLALGNPSDARDFDAIAEIRKCASVVDPVTRFACYEALGDSVTATDTVPEDLALRTQAAAGPQPDAAAASIAGAGAAVVDELAEAMPEVDTVADFEPQAAAEPAAEPAALPDDLGGQKFEEDSEEPKSEGARGNVTSCKRGPDKKWYFVFASGQVWKQVDSTRLRFDECRFSATIEKDLFGYKMIIEGRADKIRVSRRK